MSPVRWSGYWQKRGIPSAGRGSIAGAGDRGDKAWISSFSGKAWLVMVRCIKYIINLDRFKAAGKKIWYKSRFKFAAKFCGAGSVILGYEFIRSIYEGVAKGVPDH
jgi:hypothetical protein